MLFFTSLELFSFLNKTIEDRFTKKGNEFNVDVSTYGNSLHEQKYEHEDVVYYEKTQAQTCMEKLGYANIRMIVGIPPKKIYRKQEYGLSHLGF